MKGQALVEVEWVEQVLALEPLRVDPKSGLELPLSLEVEMEQELRVEMVKPGLPDQKRGGTLRWVLLSILFSFLDNSQFLIPGKE